MLIKKLPNHLTIVAVCVFLISLVVSLMAPTGVNGLSGSQFQSGRIIDDAIFFNSNSMSPQEIQNFLNSKVPVCDTNGTQPIYGTTRAAYGASQGYPAPFVCLKDYSMTIPTVTNSGSDLCGGSISGGLKSAALIIYDVAQACGINPQVLLVMLQKEQSLITDDWPWTIQYEKAMGYGCPDTAPCAPQYAGFFNQVYNAAEAFRRYEANPLSYNYRANANNFIYYHPSLGACGGTNVYIENQATANLYIYTPYQPNAAALNNLYGIGDGCSAYGNRNFWRMFNDWFGSTFATQYSHTPTAAGSSIPTNTMVKGDRAYITFQVRNTGNATWSKANTFLGTAEPFDRTSPFQDSTWINANRATQLQESSVAPGDIGTFSFWYKAPQSTGSFSEKFSIVLDGQAWTPYNGLFVSTNVVNPNYSASIVSLGTYKDPSLTVGKQTNNMAPGERAYVVLRVRNEGNRVWKNNGSNPTRIAPANPNGRQSAFNDGWLSNSRVSNMVQSSVAPGQIANFYFWYRAPSIHGNHNEQFTLVHEGITWTNYFGFFLNTTISSPTFSAQPVSSSSNIPTDTMSAGSRARVIFKVRNTGNFTWKKQNTRLGTAEPFGRISTFNYQWSTANRTSNLLEDNVSPGEIGTFEFWYQANTPGNYQEKFTPVIEGSAWIPYSGLFLNTNVTN